MMARSTTRSNQRPDTLMQDRSPPARRRLLQRTAGPYIGSIASLAHSTAASALPPIATKWARATNAAPGHIATYCSAKKGGQIRRTILLRGVFDPRVNFTAQRHEVERLGQEYLGKRPICGCRATSAYPPMATKSLHYNIGRSGPDPDFGSIKSGAAPIRAKLS